MTVRILLADDEPLALKRLQRFLEACGPGYEVASASSGPETVEAILAFRPEILFLDVEMPGLSGFEVLAQFEVRPFRVVFQTAYDHYAVDAFEECACDYLLKPVSLERFQQALQRALADLTAASRLAELEKALAEKAGPLRRICVRQGRHTRVVTEGEILCFQSQEHCTCVLLMGGGEATCDLSLQTLERRLDPESFVRIHRNSIVNGRKIKALARNPDGRWHVELTGGLLIEVSRSRRSAVKGLFGSIGSVP
jgi:two-component system LytT family response regulator